MYVATAHREQVVERRLKSTFAAVFDVTQAIIHFMNGSPPPPLNWRVYIALKACDLIRCQSSTFSCVFECFTVKVAAFSSS